MSIVVPVRCDCALDEALEQGIARARETGGTLICVLHRPAPRTQDEIDDEVDSLSARLDNEDIAFRIETVLKAKDVAGTLCEIAQVNDAELIVVALASKAQFGRLTLGTQVQRIILGAPCPVLVVHDSPNAA